MIASRRLIPAVVGSLLLSVFPALGAEPAAGPSGTPPPLEQPASTSPALCRTNGFIGVGQLPNLKQALKDGDSVRILSIGASAFSDPRFGQGGADAQLAGILNSAVQGLDVEIVNRGVSGELARQAAERIKLEAALEEPTIVLWQVGTADAFARIPIHEFTATLRSTVKWLKARDIDVVLVGLHYLRQWTRDAYVQSIRAAVRKVASEEKVLRIGRYEAEELIARAPTNGQPVNAFALTEAGYDCMAGYVARAITVGLYAKPKPDSQVKKRGL
ncbi:MAG: hypothetical protein RLZ98_583 [Pseudomonadota bacterium]|jgi:lysophospholipase L1-like esterase